MDTEAQWNSAAGILVAMITTYGLKVVGAVVILIAGRMSARFVYAAIARLCEQSSRVVFRVFPIGDRIEAGGVAGTTPMINRHPPESIAAIQSKCNSISTAR